MALSLHAFGAIDPIILTMTVKYNQSPFTDEEITVLPNSRRRAIQHDTKTKGVLGFGHRTNHFSQLPTPPTDLNI